MVYFFVAMVLDCKYCVGIFRDGQFKISLSTTWFFFLPQSCMFYLCNHGCAVAIWCDNLVDCPKLEVLNLFSSFPFLSLFGFRFKFIFMLK